VAFAWPVPSKWAPRSFTTTFAPCLAMSSASSRPIPRPEPVTIATFPSSNIRVPPCEMWGIRIPAPAHHDLSRRFARQPRPGREPGIRASPVRRALRIANVLVAVVTLASALAVLASDLAVPGYREHYRDALWFVLLYVALQFAILVAFVRDDRAVPWLAVAKA